MLVVFLLTSYMSASFILDLTTTTNDDICFNNIDNALIMNLIWQHYWENVRHFINICIFRINEKVYKYLCLLNAFGLMALWFYGMNIKFLCLKIAVNYIVIALFPYYIFQYIFCMLSYQQNLSIIKWLANTSLDKLYCTSYYYCYLHKWIKYESLVMVLRLWL